MEGLALAPTDEPEAGDVALVERELVAFNVARSIPYDRRPLSTIIASAAMLLAN